MLVLDDWLPDALMLAITQENNLAETAFVKPRVDGAWDLRWFAPAHEVDFCGHATLATAHVLFTKYGASGGLVFHTRAGELRASQQQGGYRLDFPRLNAKPITTLPADLTGIFGTPPAHLFRNFENIFADLGHTYAVRAFAPDLAAIMTHDMTDGANRDLTAENRKKLAGLLGFAKDLLNARTKVQMSMASGLGLFHKSDLEPMIGV